MNFLHIYLEFAIEASASLAIFTAFYIAVLKRLTHYQWSRFFLLGALVVSIAIGSVTIEVIEPLTPYQPIASGSLSDFYPAFESRSETTAVASNVSLISWLATNWKWLAPGFTLVVGTGFFFLLLARIILLTRKLRSSVPHPSFVGVHISSNFKSAFAFLGKVYLPVSMLELTEEEVAKVVEHERLHIRYGHSMDLLLLNLLKPIFWYNPVFWFILNELRAIHEYQVDRDVQRADDRFAYPELLLKLSSSQPQSTLEIHFAQRLIKRRIGRLFQSQTHAAKKALFMLALPIVPILFYAFSIESVVQSAPTASVAHEIRPLIIPLPIDAITRVSAFGLRTHPMNNSRTMQTGIDFVAAENTPIFAAANGVVLSVETSNKGYGNKVEIEHDKGLSTTYAHLKSFSVTPGETVSKGQQIALCGTTGLSTGPHLHFEVISDTTFVDPEGYLSMAPLVKRLNDLNIETEELVVIIDAGHGGKDAGSTEGVIEEKAITMSYANALKEALADHNVKVITTRSGDESLDLKERTEKSKNHKEALFISIHVNQAKSDGAKGFEIFIPESNHAEFLKSQKFARSIEYQMQDGEMASRGIKSANYWILTHTECPVVLVELGFMSSEIDRALLTSEEYKETWARKMASSIDVYAR